MERKFTLGNSPECDIAITTNSIIAPKQLEFDYRDNNMFVRNLDKRYPVFINNESLKENFKLLDNGDTIFAFGVKMVCIGKNIFLNQNKNKLQINFNLFNSILPPSNNLNLRPEDEDDSDLYKESEYFTRAPRLISVIEEELRIDNPPAAQEISQLPLIISVGSMMGMGLIMVLNSINNIMKNIENQQKGVDNSRQIKILIITLSVMLFTMIILPLVNKRYQKNALEKKELAR